MTINDYNESVKYKMTKVENSAYIYKIIDLNYMSIIFKVFAK
jgi:hypothetical protein